MIHHDDAADATVAALHRGGADTVYNIVDDTPVTWRSYVESIASAATRLAPGVPGWLLRALAPYAGLFMTGLSMTVATPEPATSWGGRRLIPRTWRGSPTPRSGPDSSGAAPRPVADVVRPVRGAAPLGDACGARYFGASTEIPTRRHAPAARRHTSPWRRSPVAARLPGESHPGAGRTMRMSQPAEGLRG